MPSGNAPTTPEEYIAQLEEPRRSQIQAIYDLIREAAPDLEPWMVSGKIGFGKFAYRGKSGREGEWFKLGLASNKNTIMVATCAPGEGGVSMAQSYADRLPKAKIGGSCINFRKFEDADLEVLREITSKTAGSDFKNWLI